MENENKKGFDWDAFGKDFFADTTPVLKVFPFEEGKVYQFGFSRVSIDMENFEKDGKGLAPIMRLYINRCDTEPSLGKHGYAISSRSRKLLSMVKAAEDAGYLYNSMFRVCRYGEDYIDKDGVQRHVTSFDFERIGPR